MARRKALGLKQFELARKAQIASAQLCKVENGRVNPSFNMVERIAAALDSTIPELLYDEGRKRLRKTVEAGGPVVAAEESIDSNYIPLRAVEPGARKVLKALGVGPGETLFTLAPVAPVCTIAWARVRPRYEGAGAALAESLRGELGIGAAPVGDLTATLCFRGVEIVEAKLAKDVGSLSFWNGARRAPLIVLDSGSTKERRLYRLVYELGSAVLYASLGVRLDETLDQHRFLTDFTAAFLMPAVSVRMCVAAIGVAPADWTLEKALPLKSYFGVSAESFILRLDELGLIQPKLRLALRDQLRAYYKKHPKAMEPVCKTVKENG